VGGRRRAEGETQRTRLGSQKVPLGENASGGSGIAFLTTARDSEQEEELRSDNIK